MVRVNLVIKPETGSVASGAATSTHLLFDANFMPLEGCLSSSQSETRPYAWSPLATWLAIAPAIARVTLQDYGGRSA